MQRDFLFASTEGANVVCHGLGTLAALSGQIHFLGSGSEGGAPVYVAQCEDYVIDFGATAPGRCGRACGARPPLSANSSGCVK